MNDVADLVIKLISNLGFPIFVALYFMFSMQKTLRTLSDTIENYTKVSETVHDCLHEIADAIKRASSKE